MAAIVNQDMEDTVEGDTRLVSATITYAFDLPSAFMMCPVREMSRMGLSLAQLRARAVANLRPQAANVQLGGKPPVLVVKTGNDLEACMLLLDESWHQLAGRVPGQMLIAVPTRSVLLVTSAGSELGIQVVRETIVEAQRHVPRDDAREEADDDRPQHDAAPAGRQVERQEDRRHELDAHRGREREPSTRRAPPPAPRE